MSRLPRHTTVFARAHTHICVFAAARTFADLRTLLIHCCVRRRRQHCAAGNRGRQWFIWRSCESSRWDGWLGRRRYLEFAVDDHHRHIALRTSRRQLFDNSAIQWWPVTCAVDSHGWKPPSRSQSFAVWLRLRYSIHSRKLHLHCAGSRFFPTKSHAAIQSHGDHGRSCDHHCVAAERYPEHGLQLPDPNE